MSLLDFPDAIARQLCERKLKHFARLAWPILEPVTELKWGWALDAICDHLEAVTNGDIKRLLMNVPPGSMKSLLTSVIWPAWTWGPKGLAHKRFLSTAHKQDLAVRDNMKCRRLIQSEWYQRLWPTALVGDQNSKLKFENSATGFREAMAFGSMTGSRGDCFLAGTMISTETGAIPIENIAISAVSCNVLSYDEHSRKLVYRPVEAVARRSAKDFYRVHFAGGGLVECTGDHRFYTARGYIEARLLSADDILLRAVRDSGQAQRLRDEEVREEGAAAADVQPSLQSDRDEHCCWQVRQSLHDLRIQGNTPRPAPVLTGVQSEGVVGEDGAGKKTPTTRNQLRDVQQDVPAAHEYGDAEVLLEAVSGGGSFDPHAGRGQSGLAQRHERAPLHQPVASTIPQDQEQDSRAGWRPLRRLPVAERPLRPSYRHGPGAQCLEQSSDALPILPCDVALEGAIGVAPETVALVEHVREPTLVYDIQVAGTRCFFANGVLVHNCVILDDPHSVDDANSKLILEGDVRTFREALPSRVNNEHSAIVIIMQRLNEADVSAVALELGYEHLCIPMRYEADRTKPTSIGWSDPRTIDGELMFPERFGEAQVVELETSLGSYAAAGQLQQRPAPREGGMFKRRWFEIVDAAPAGLTMARAWDLAATVATGSNDPDWTVGVKMGRDTAGFIYILDMVRFRGSAAEVERTILATAQQDGKAVSIHLPQDPGQAGKAQAGALTRMLGGWVVSAKPPTGSKDVRATPFAAQAEAGNIKLVQAHWNEALFDEIEVFPFGRHDDAVDAAADAFNALHDTSGSAGFLQMVRQDNHERHEREARTNAPPPLAAGECPYPQGSVEYQRFHGLE